MQNRRILAAATAASLIGVMVLGFPLTASAATYTWYHGSRIAPDVWHSVTTGATYNGATVKSAYLYARAYVSINGGVSQATGQVSTSFAYQRVTAKCMWDFGGATNINDLDCQLHY
jgi:hypothetical protein